MFVMDVLWVKGRVRELGFTMAYLAPQLNISQPAVSMSVQSGEQIASENRYSLMDE